MEIINPCLEELSCLIGSDVAPITESYVVPVTNRDVASSRKR